MSRNRELARKVARILIRKVPKSKESLISTGELLTLLATMYAKDRYFRNYFVSPFISRESKLSLIEKLVGKTGAPQEVLEVLEYLIDINGFSLLTEVKRLYAHEMEKLMRMSKGYLYLADELEKEDINRIMDVVQKALNREIDVEVRYDDSLIGGFILKTSGFVVDTSVKRQLERLLHRGG